MHTCTLRASFFEEPIWAHWAWVLGPFRVIWANWGHVSLLDLLKFQKCQFLKNVFAPVARSLDHSCPFRQMFTYVDPLELLNLNSRHVCF